MLTNCVPSTSSRRFVHLVFALLRGPISSKLLIRNRFADHGPSALSRGFGRLVPTGFAQTHASWLEQARTDVRIAEILPALLRKVAKTIVTEVVDTAGGSPNP